MKKLIVIAMVLLATVVFAAQTGNVLVSWNANTEADLAGYYVYFNNVQVGNVVAPARTWAGSVTFVEGNNVAQVAAYDKCSPIPNTSAKSAVTLASTLVFDSTAPAVPTGCAVQAQ
jgi:hypothetical protein